MALAILDGTQTATTLSTILSSGQHITAHTVVSLGSQAKTDILSAVSSGIAISGTVTIGNSYVNFLSANQNDGNLRENINEALVAFGSASALPISGTLHADIYAYSTQSDDQIKLRGYSNGGQGVCLEVCGPSINGVTVGGIPGVPVFGSVTVGNTVTIAGTVTANPTGTQTIAGSVTASISSFATSVTARLINPAGTAVTYAEVGTAGNPSIDVLSVQGVTAGTPLNVYAMQGTTVSNTNFTSTTASTSLVSAVTGREVLTVFNEGAGNLHISPGATATTISYQVRLSAGDYWECPQGQLSLAHTAVFATAGTARVTEVS